MDNKLVSAVLVVAVLGLLGVSAFKNTTVTVNNPAPSFGATSGPENSGPFISVSGVASWFDKQQIKTATSTLCSFKSPSATSSLEHFSVDFTSLPTYATSYAVGNDPTAFSTTTIITANANMTYSASVTGTSIASSTKFIVSPNTYVNLKLSTTTAGASATYAPVGTCEVEFRTVR